MESSSRCVTYVERNLAKWLMFLNVPTVRKGYYARNAEVLHFANMGSKNPNVGSVVAHRFANTGNGNAFAGNATAHRFANTGRENRNVRNATVRQYAIMVKTGYDVRNVTS